MTKERRLAIEMWNDIADKLERGEIGGWFGSISQSKYKFCLKHNLKWAFGCWFCQYIMYCYKCPIRKKAVDIYGCNVRGSLFDTVIDINASKRRRVNAARKIVKALGG